MYDTYVYDTFGKERISLIKKSNVKKFYNTLADGRRLKAATIDHIHTVLQQRMPTFPRRKASLTAELFWWGHMTTSPTEIPRNFL